MNKIRFSVLIPVYKESPFLRELLDSILSNNVSKEILVGIDCPTKESLKIVSEYSKKGIRFILSKKRQGKATCLNKLASISKGNYLVFIDADTKIEPQNFLEILEKELERKRLDIVEVNKTMSGNLLEARIFDVGMRLQSLANYITINKFGKGFGVCGYFICIKKDLFEKIKGFRKIIVEDADLSFRLNMLKTKWKYCSRIKITQVLPDKRKKLWPKIKRWIFGIGLFIKGIINNPHLCKTYMSRNVSSFLLGLPILFPAFIMLSILTILTYPVFTIHRYRLFTSPLFPFNFPLQTGMFIFSFTLYLALLLPCYFLYKKFLRKINLDLRFFNFTIYYLISPFFLFSYIFAIFYSYLTKPKFEDWKV